MKNAYGKIGIRGRIWLPLTSQCNVLFKCKTQNNTYLCQFALTLQILLGVYTYVRLWKNERTLLSNFTKGMYSYVTLVCNSYVSRVYIEWKHRSVVTIIGWDEWGTVTHRDLTDCARHSPSLWSARSRAQLWRQTRSPDRCPILVHIRIRSLPPAKWRWPNADGLCQGRSSYKRPSGRDTLCSVLH